MVNLIAGLLAGLIRIGWDFPLTPVAVHHGAIMVGGFFTTLIALEKIIPLKRNFLLIIPLISALSLIIVVEGYYFIGQYFLLAGSLGLLAIQSVYFYRAPRDRSALLMVIGADCLVAGNILLMQKQFYPSSFPWWMGFLLFTVIGERLELSRFLPVSDQAKNLLFVFLALFLIGLIIPFHGIGKYISGLALICISVWMLRNDVIRIGLRNTGLVKYSSVALLLAHVSLLLEGVFLFALPDALFAYDISVHTFFIGFGFTMVFAHGPIILPAVLGINSKPYHPVLYLWLFLLQGSLLLRILSDSIVNMEWRKFSGLITVITILLYFITLVVQVIRTRQRISANIHPS